MRIRRLGAKPCVARKWSPYEMRRPSLGPENITPPCFCAEAEKRGCTTPTGLQESSHLKKIPPTARNARHDHPPSFARYHEAISGKCKPCARANSSSSTDLFPIGKARQKAGRGAGGSKACRLRKHLRPDDVDLPVAGKARNERGIRCFHQDQARTRRARHHCGASASPATVPCFLICRLRAATPTISPGSAGRRSRTDPLETAGVPTRNRRRPAMREV